MRELPKPSVGVSAFVTQATPYRWCMLAGAWLIYFSFGVMIASLAPLVGPITAELGFDYAVMGAILAAWQLGYVVAAIPCGDLLDRVTLRSALFACTLAMALSGLLRAAAFDRFSLFAAVALFGFGAPLISVGGPKLIALWFASQERGLAMGIFSTGPALGAVLSFSLTNSVFMPVSGNNWRVVIIAYSVLVLAVAAIWLLIHTSPVSRAVDGAAAAGEPKAPHRETLTQLVAIREVRIILLMGFGVFFFNQALNNWLPEILRFGGMDSVAAGYWASVPTAVGIVSSLILPPLAVSASRFVLLLVLFICAGTATVLIAHSELAVALLAGLVMQGIARGVLRPVLVLMLIEAPEVGARRAGSATGLFFSVAEAGGFLGSVTVGLLFDATGGFLAPLYVLTATSAVLMLLLFKLRGTSALRQG
jgi:CP family cyanate transporter-like MFS transporter